MTRRAHIWGTFGGAGLGIGTAALPRAPAGRANARAVQGPVPHFLRVQPKVAAVQAHLVDLDERCMGISGLQAHPLLLQPLLMTSWTTKALKRAAGHGLALTYIKDLTQSSVYKYRIETAHNLHKWQELA